MDNSSTDFSPLPGLTVIPLRDWSPRYRQWFNNLGIVETAVFDIPLTIKFRQVTSRQGLLIRGEQGWGECSPFYEYGPMEASTWLLSAVREATQIPLPTVRTLIPVNVTIPVMEANAAGLRAANSGCRTAKVKVADPRTSIDADAQRVRAVSEALAQAHGEQARVRIDVNGAWNRDVTLPNIQFLNEAAESVGGLEYVEQPCMDVEDLAFVRSRTSVKVAADESIRRAEDPQRVVELAAADLAVIKVAPLGGAASAYQIMQQLGLDAVVSSAIDTSIGLASGVELAAALPALPYACGLDTRRLLKSDVSILPLTSVDGNLDVGLARQIRRADLSTNCLPVARNIVAEWTDRIGSMIDYLEGTGTQR